MRLDRPLAEVELACELGVALAGGEQPQHLELAFGQTLEARVVLLPGRALGVLRDHSPRDRRGEQGVARRDRAYRVHELLWRRVLEQETARAGAERLEDVLVLLEGGQDDD